MTKNKVLKGVEDQISSILANADAKIEEAHKKANAAHEAQDKAANDIALARKDGNVEAYTKANEELKLASDSRRMFYDIADSIDTEPLITKDEYEAMLSQINLELDSVNTKAKERAATLFKQIEQISQETNEYINYGNTLMNKLQHEVYKDRAELPLSNGKMVHVDSLEKRYKNRGFSQLIDWIINTDRYKYVMNGGK